MVGLLLLGIQNAYPALAASDFFRMSRISVVGNRLLPEGDVVVWSGLEIGDNLFACNLETATDRLEAQPMIEQALLLREPPETLVIELQEREPVALLATPEGLMGLNAEGIVFPLPQVPLDLPAVTGITVIRDSTGRWQADRLANIATFVNQLKRRTPDFWQDVSEVCMAQLGLATVYLVGDGLALRMRLEEADRQVHKFKTYVNAVKDQGIDLAYVDLRYRDQVVIGKP